MRTRTTSSFPIHGQITKLALPIALSLPLGASAAAELCTRSAIEARASCRNAAVADFWLQRAKCTNLPTPQERMQCFASAVADMQEAMEECDEQHAARVELCDELGNGVYHPVIDPKDFVRGVDNPYFPLVPGTTMIYEKKKADETERVEVTVTREIEEILGVACTAVRDVVTVGGEVQEDTFDWFAQDVWGNVWYFGELSFSYDDGEISGTGGSWKAGEDGAKPGIIMEAVPQVGDVYRQEFFIGEAEDAAAVLSLTERVKVEYGRFTDCLQTEDFSPLEPGNVEHKYYAPDVGLILELDPGSGERLELIEILTN